jgi:hypothetical protein
MTESRPPTIRRRLIPICLAWSGTAAGLLAGTAAVAGNGLAGPPAVLAAGLLGLVVGSVAGLAGAKHFSGRAVRWLAPAAGLLAVSLAAALALQIHRGRAAHTAIITADVAGRTAAFQASATAPRADDGSSFVEIEVDGAHDTFAMTVRHRPGQPKCRGEVSAARHLALLEAVRAADARLTREPSACTPLVGEIIRTFRWRLPERGGHPREVAVTPACAGAYGEFERLYAELDGLGFAAASTAGALICDLPPAAAHD